jgi:hypothetical protein
MDLAQARERIHQTVSRMREIYLRPVFDEWVVLSLDGPHGVVVAYSGPRPDSFRKSLADDTGPLREIASGRSLTDGDFEFAQEAESTRYDALLKTGPTSYLICNNTTKAMSEIRSDERWKKAQAEFFRLAEAFREDPLKVAS